MIRLYSYHSCVCLSHFITVVHAVAIHHADRPRVSGPIYKIPFITSAKESSGRGGATRKACGLAISRSRVQILLEATLRNNLGQVVHTYVLLSPSSITWYRPKGGDGLRLGR